MLTKVKVMKMTEAMVRVVGETTRKECEAAIAEMSDAEKIEWLLAKVQRLTTSDMYLRLKNCSSQEIERLYHNTIG